MHQPYLSGEVAFLTPGKYCLMHYHDPYRHIGLKIICWLTVFWKPTPCAHHELSEHRDIQYQVGNALELVYERDNAILREVDSDILEGQVSRSGRRVAGRYRTSCHEELELDERE